MKVKRSLSGFAGDEGGAAMVWSLFWAMIFLVVGGLALDSSNAWRVRAQLQATADASALAAAVQGADQDAGRAASLATALQNMSPDDHGVVLQDADVVYGIWDTASQSLTPDTTDPNAVQVTVRRTAANNNRLQTTLLNLVGFEYFDVAATSVAAMRTGGPIACAGATIMTTDFVDTGGGNELFDGVCIYGRTGVRTGGDDLIVEGVRIGALNEGSVILNFLRSGSAQPDQIRFEGDVSPVILPELANIRQELWDELGDPSVTSYSGDLLPEFIFDGDGNANVVHIDQGWWTVQSSSDLQENTIYMVNHGMQLAGGVDASNVAIIANGQIGVGGGPALEFDNVFMFGSGALNFSGDVLWGDQAALCGDGVYRVYLFSQDSISLGGFGSATGAYGVIGAAPRFSPGGALKNSGGLYIEASQYTALGGDMNIVGCGEALEGDLETASFPQEGGGSYLVH